MKLADGTALVIVFYTKNMIDVRGGLAPFISINLTDPDGKPVLERAIMGDPNDFQASREGCDVRIGVNRFSGDLRDYTIHLDSDGIAADIRLRGTTPAWRPATGHSFFVNGGRENFFAWLPAVPRGEAAGTLTVDGETMELSGSGYHDHNWGDISMLKLMHDWYWGRAEVGPYTVITACITATERYGGGSNNVFLLARDGEILAEDGRFVTCTPEDVYIDSHSGKPVANIITYLYDDGTDRYRVRYERQRDLADVRFIDLAGGWRRFAARLAGFDGAYLRFTGPVTIERLENGRVAETATEDAAVWELMYFGHAPAN